MNFKNFLTFLAFFSAFTIEAQDRVLMRINNEPVTQSEFEYIYNKNNSDNAIDKKTLDEYLDLFTVFKLKVAAAKEAGIDTTDAYRHELEGYRQQLSESYLTDKKREEQLKKEAHNRLKENVNVSHILVRLTEADTLPAYQKALEIKKRLDAIKQVDKESFETIAREVSEDPSAKENGGKLGFITTFMTVYPFETVAYNTPVGKISQPVRSQFGYHIIKVNARRPDPGKMHIAHIMVATPKSATADTLTVKEQRINEIAKRLQAGESFESLLPLSDDKAPNGELPWFGIGRILPAIEAASFALKVGEVSKPVKSAAGWHIIKLLDKKTLEPYEQMQTEIDKQFRQDTRSLLPYKSFLKNLRKDYKLTVNQAALNDFYALGNRYAVSDSLFRVEAAKFGKQPIFTFADRQVSQADFANYLARQTFIKDVAPKLIIDESLTSLEDEQLAEYEKMQLERKHTDFHNLMQEYRDGILLFEISNRNVWEKASSDTLGLEQFYEKNKAKYTWSKPHFKGRIIYAPDEATANTVKQLIAESPKDSIDARLRTNKDIITKIKLQKGLYAEGDNAAVDKLAFHSGTFESSKDYPVAFVAEGSELLAQPKGLDDVRGQVVSDYQNYLEGNWVKALKTKYPVEVYQEVWKTIKKK